MKQILSGLCISLLVACTNQQLLSRELPHESQLPSAPIAPQTKGQTVPNSSITPTTKGQTVPNSSITPTTKGQTIIKGKVVVPSGFALLMEQPLPVFDIKATTLNAEVLGETINLTVERVPVSGLVLHSSRLSLSLTSYAIRSIGGKPIQISPKDHINSLRFRRVIAQS